MAAGKSAGLRDSIINAVLRGVAYTSPTAVYIALHSGDPGDAGTSFELVGGGYARQAVTFSAPSGGEVKNSAEILFPSATATWPTVTHLSLWSAATGGQCLYQGPLITPVSIASGSQFKFQAQALSVKEV